ncbi:hypothetical protein BST61_g7463 [Cercospora zeina]
MAPAKMQAHKFQKIGIWNLPQELRDIVYEEVLTKTETPGQLPSELNQVCRRMRQETYRLYEHKKIRTWVLWNYWKPLSYTISDQNSLLSYRELHVRTSQDSRFNALRLGFIMSHAITGHRRVSMVNLSLISNTGDIWPFRLRPRLDIVGPDVYTQADHLTNVIIAKLLEETGHRLSSIVDGQDAWQRKMGSDLCCELFKSVRRLLSGWTTVLLNQTDL